LRHYLELYRTINKTFGFRLRPLGTFAVLQLRQAISSATMGLDRVFFRGYRKQPIDRPIFIVGNPRSGTTFLHRLLLGSGDDLAGIIVSAFKHDFGKDQEMPDAAFARRARELCDASDAALIVDDEYL
jgi:hypothetical protein